MSGSSALCDLVLKQKSSEKIARPPNAFMLFARDNRSVLASKNREVTNKTISMMLGKMWRSLGPDVKGAYYEQAKYLNDLHKKRFPGYVYSPQEARRRKQEKKVMKVGKRASKVSVFKPIGEEDEEEVDSEKHVDTFEEAEQNTTWNAKPKDDNSPGYVPNNPSFFQSEKNLYQYAPFQAMTELCEGGQCRCADVRRCDGNINATGSHQDIHHGGPSCFQNPPFPEGARLWPGHRSGRLSGSSGQDACCGGHIRHMHCGCERDGGEVRCAVRSPDSTWSEHAMGYDYGNVPGAVSSPQNTCLVGDPNKMDGWKSPSAFHSSTSPFQNNYVSPRLLEPGSRASYTQMVPPYMFLTTANRTPLPRFHPLFLNSTYPKPEYFDVLHSSYDGPRSRIPVTVPQGMHDARRQAYFPQSARTMEASSSTSAVPYMHPSLRPAYVSSDFRKNGYPFQSPHGYQVHDEIPQTRYALQLPHTQSGFYDALGNRTLPSSLPTTSGHDNVPPSKSYSDYTIHNDSTQDKEITPSREEKMTSVEVKTEDEEEAGMRIIENGSLGKTHDQVIDEDVDEEINVDT